MAYGDVEQSFKFRFNNSDDFRLGVGDPTRALWVSSNKFYIDGLRSGSNTKKIVELSIPPSSSSGTIAATITDSVTSTDGSSTFWDFVADSTNLYGFRLTFTAQNDLEYTVFKYRLSDLTYVSEFNLSGVTSTITWYSDAGFWFDGTTFYVVNRVPNQNDVKAYGWTTTGARDSSKDFTLTNPFATFDDQGTGRRVESFFGTSDRWYVFVTQYLNSVQQARVVPFLKSNRSVIENDIVQLPAGITGGARIDSSGDYLWAVGGGFQFAKISLERVVTQPLPGIPTGLTGTAGNATVTLSWNTVSGATAYSVEYRAGTSGDWTLHSDSIVVNGVTVSGLTNSQSYQFRVRAENPTGNSDWTTPISRTPVAPPVPGVPRTLTATAGDEQVTLRWGGVAHANSYTVEFRSGTSGSWSVRSNIVVVFYVVSELTNSQSYQFRVKAVGTHGESGYTTIVSATPEDATAVDNTQIPQTPNGIIGSPGDSQISLVWNESENASSYTVTYRQQTISDWTVWSSTLQTNEAIITGLTNDITYEVRVRASNSGDASDWSETVVVTPTIVTEDPIEVIPAPETPPAIPSHVRLSTGDGNIYVSWIEAPRASFYNLRFRVTSLNEWSYLYDIVDENYLLEGLLEAVEYQVAVQAKNSFGVSDWTEPVSETVTKTIQTPSVPGFRFAGENGQIRITPFSTEGVETYEVRHRESGGTWGDIQSFFVHEIPIYITELKNGTTYQFQVRAKNTAGTSDWSAVSTTTPSQGLSSAPEPVTGFEGTPGDEHVELEWYDPNGGGQIELESRIGSGAWKTEINRQLAIHPPYAVINLKNGTTYEFRIRAWNSHGNSTWRTFTSTPNSVFARIQKPVTKERLVLINLGRSTRGLCSGSYPVWLPDSSLYGTFRNKWYDPWIQVSSEVGTELVYQTNIANPTIDLKIPSSKVGDWIRDRIIGEELAGTYLERENQEGTWELSEYGFMGLLEELDQTAESFSITVISLLERFTKRDIRRWSDHSHQTEYPGDLWFSKLSDLSVKGSHVVLLKGDD